MLKHLRWLMWAGLVLVLATSRGASPQGNPDPFGFKFTTGQSIQPIFEGWAKNPDGSVSMHFGYMNRNYVEQVQVPIGPDNKCEPGAPDCGQPTFFYTRIHRKAFSVALPKDWGKKEFVWSLTVRGKTEKAVAWLQPEWEIDPIYAGKARSAESLMNKAPKMVVDAAATLALPNALTLTAAVTDDGLPKPRKDPPQRAVGQETPPTLKPVPGQPEIPVNVPEVQTDSDSGRGRGRSGPQGLFVTWIMWRGPSAVTFDPATVEVKDGKAVVTARFATPGVYVLRGRANDGELSDEKDVNVTVSESAR
jgi:hypothetical protein